MALGELRDLLARPRAFFADRQPERLRPYALAAVLGTGLLSLLAELVRLRLALSRLPPALPDGPPGGYGLLVAVSLLGSLLVWGLYAGVVHVVVRSHADRATFGRTFAVVGLAALVGVFATVVGTLETLYAFLSASGEGTALAPSQPPSANDGPLSLAVTAVTILWEGYIWREGLLGAYDLPADRATLAAGAAVAVSLVLAVRPVNLGLG